LQLPPLRRPLPRAMFPAASSAQARTQSLQKSGYNLPGGARQTPESISEEQ